jgi:hypothetical protein
MGVNHHRLSDFRVGCGEFPDRLLTANVAARLSCGAMTMERVAQDGLRARASFRRKARLQDCLAQAQAQVIALKREIEDDPDATNRRQQAARERAATAECVNVLARNRGLNRFNLRGLDKIKNVLLWFFVLAHNLMRIAELAPAMIGPGWSA